MHISTGEVRLVVGGAYCLYMVMCHDLLVREYLVQILIPATRCQPAFRMVH